jgi:hypothetical protein
VTKRWVRPTSSGSVRSPPCRGSSALAIASRTISANASPCRSPVLRVSRPSPVAGWGFASGSITDRVLAYVTESTFAVIVAEPSRCSWKWTSRPGVHPAPRRAPSGHPARPRAPSGHPAPRRAPSAPNRLAPDGGVHMHDEQELHVVSELAMPRCGHLSRLTRSLRAHIDIRSGAKDRVTDDTTTRVPRIGLSLVRMDPRRGG